MSMSYIMGELMQVLDVIQLTKIVPLAKRRGGVIIGAVVVNKVYENDS
jgi:hypothetical protein